MVEKYTVDLELTSIFGITLSSDKNYKKYEDHPSFPLRHRLITVSRFCWHNLLIEHHSRKNVLAVCRALNDEFHKFLTDDEFVNYQEEPGSRYEKSGRPTLNTWSISADLEGPIACLKRRLDSSRSASKSSAKWRTDDIYNAAALLAVDYSAKYLERNEPYKAGAWCASAHEYRGMALALSLSENAASNLGKIASDSRHAKNREIQKIAIEIYKSKKWPSQAQAARIIGAQLHREPEVVGRWIRRHRKATLPAK